MKSHLAAFNNGKYKLVSTQEHVLIKDELIVLLRNWGEQGLEQQLLEDIMHFLSIENEESDLTSPFEYYDGLSELSNKVRSSISLANQTVAQANKDLYQYGFEIAVIVQRKNEIAVGFLGQFEVALFQEQTKINQTLIGYNTSWNTQQLIPAALLGVDKNPQILSMSISFDELKQKNELRITTYFSEETQIAYSLKN